MPHNSKAERFWDFAELSHMCELTVKYTTQHCMIVAQPQAVHERRLGLVLFPIACGAAAANHWADNSQCGLTEW